MGRRCVAFRHLTGTCFLMEDPTCPVGCLLFVLVLVLEVEGQRWFAFP